MRAEGYMGAEAFLPEGAASVTALRRASRRCRGCPLYERATQTVFGVGSEDAPVTLVGEQPGDKGDLEGVSFVGPAGQLPMETLEEIGTDPADLYITNVVKHFKWEARGKARLHKKPSTHEVEACTPWILAEIAAVHPKIIVCLGATAAQAFLGRAFGVTRKRGQTLPGPLDIPLMATVHPSHGHGPPVLDPPSPRCRRTHDGAGALSGRPACRTEVTLRDLKREVHLRQRH